MTVNELIERLSDLPSGARVMCSREFDLEKNDIELRRDKNGWPIVNFRLTDACGQPARDKMGDGPNIRRCAESGHCPFFEPTA